jgi:hypothetical protein
MGFILLKTKKAADDSQLFLVRDEQGEKYLFEPLNLSLSSKENMFIDLLRELRKIIRNPLELDQNETKIFCYHGIEKFQQETCLVLAYNQQLWDHWEEKGLQIYSLQEVAEVGVFMTEILDLVKETELGFEGFFPGDLLPLGAGAWGILDPRVQKLLSPYRVGEELREFYFPPEIIAGSSWSQKSFVYTLGLTLYSMSTGILPFPLEKKRETITAILKEEPLDPRYYQPKIGAGLAILIQDCLKKKPDSRPDEGGLKQEIKRIIEEQDYFAQPEEEVKFKNEAETVQEKVKKKRQLYWWWQKLKWPILVSPVLIILAILLSRGGYEEQITPETKPLEVVNQFYEGFKNLNTMQMEEPLAKGVGKEYINMATFMHVTSKTRQAYEHLNIPFLKIDDLEIRENEDSTEENPSFTGEYILKMLTGDEYQVQSRRDRLVLKRIKNKWRIGELETEILSESSEPAL